MPKTDSMIFILVYLVKVSKAIQLWFATLDVLSTRNNSKFIGHIIKQSGMFLSILTNSSFSSFCFYRKYI